MIYIYILYTYVCIERVYMSARSFVASRSFAVSLSHAIAAWELQGGVTQAHSLVRKGVRQL